MLTRFLQVIGSLCIVLFLISAAAAQELGELQVQPIPDSESAPIVFRNPDQALLVVQTTLQSLSFEANMGVISVEHPEEGTYYVHLRPGTNIVTFKSEGYVPAKKRYYLQAKEYVQVKVDPRAGSAQSNAEVVLLYQPPPGSERVQGSLDGNVMNLIFRNGQVVIRPDAGQHTIELYYQNKSWKKEFSIGENDQQQFQVEFTGQSLPPAAKEPGGLYIETNPPGAKVLMNEVEQGQTPLTLDTMTAGTYNVEITKPLYLTENLTLEVRPFEYTKQSVDLTPNYGALKIRSNPAGAWVYLNDDPRGRTPLDIQKIDARSYTIRLVKPLFADVETQFELEPGKAFEKTFELTPQFGRIQLNTAPPRAQVTVDGKYWGTTPLSRDTVLAGSHVITLSKDLYASYEDKIQIKPGESYQKNTILQPNFGVLSINSTSSQVKVKVEGPTTTTVTTPVTELKLKSGTYTLQFEKTGYESQKRTALIAVGSTEEVSVDLTRESGNILVSTAPQGATIYLDGNERGESPTVLKSIPTGLHNFLLEKQGYDRITGSIVVQKHQTLNLSRQLSMQGVEEWRARRANAIAFASFLPGTGQFISRQYGRGILYTTGFWGGLIVGIRAYNSFNQAASSYDEYRQAYQARKIQTKIDSQYEMAREQVDKMQAAKQIMNIAVPVISSIYAVQFLDALIWGGGKRPVNHIDFNKYFGLNIALSIDERGAKGVQVSLVWEKR